MSRDVLPYGRQHIDQQDIDSVIDVLSNDFLTDGPVVKKFESALSRAFNVDQTVACSTGTSALHLASMGLGIGQEKDDVVIVPAITFCATANAPFMTGAKVVFSDVDPDNGLIGLEQLEEAYERAKKIGTPKAVFPVHLNGQIAPMDEISTFAKNNDLFVVEDACHAIGGTYFRNGEKGVVGDAASSDAVCFSFHPVKTIAMGEGGAISSCNPDLLYKMRQLRGHGVTKHADDFSDRELYEAPSGGVNPWYQEMQYLGNNYRVSDIQCALGISQLSKLQLFVDKRSSLVQLYRELLGDAHDCLRLIKVDESQAIGWSLMVVIIDFIKVGKDRASVMRELLSRGIRTQVHYLPVPWHSFWKKNADTPDLPNSAYYYEHALSIPLFYDMSDDDVGYVASQLLDILSS